MYSYVVNMLCGDKTSTNRRQLCRTVPKLFRALYIIPLPHMFIPTPAQYGNYSANLQLLHKLFRLYPTLSKVCNMYSE